MRKSEKHTSSAPKRRRRTAVPSGQASHFEDEVRQCAGELNRIMPFLLADYSAAAVAASLAIHAVRALARCVRTGEVSRQQAGALIERMKKLKLGKRTIVPRLQ